jgi:hypothetical protein
MRTEARYAGRSASASNRGAEAIAAEALEDRSLGNVIIARHERFHGLEEHVWHRNPASAARLRHGAWDAPALSRLVDVVSKWRGGAEMTNEEALQVERDALARYWRAVQRVDGIQQAWQEAGGVLTVVLSNGIECEDALHKLLREAERDCERFARAIPRPEKRRPGRKPVGITEPSPAAKVREKQKKLRAVE